MSPERFELRRCTRAVRRDEDEDVARPVDELPHDDLEILTWMHDRLVETNPRFQQKPEDGAAVDD